MSYEDSNRSYKKKGLLGRCISSHPLAFAFLAAGILILAAFLAYFILTMPDKKISLAAFDEASLKNSGSVNKLAEGLKDPDASNKSNQNSTSSTAKDSNKSSSEEALKTGASESKEGEKVTVSGVAFPVRESFIDPVDISYNWGDSGNLLEELSARMSGRYVPSSVLWFDSDNVEFSHQGVGCAGIKLYRDETNYKIALSTPLTGSAASDQSAEVLKAMLCLFSSTPLELYDAILDSYTGPLSHGINTEKYTVIGDAKVKVKVSDGSVVYLIHSKGDSVKKYTVVLDPGHGGCFPGAVANDITEKKVTLTLAKKISAYLTENYSNVKVVLTRKKDIELDTDLVKDLEMRAEIAEEKDADLLVSLHLNASNDHSAKGATVYVTNRDLLHEDAAALGQCILNRLVGLGLRDRGVQTRDSSDMFDEYGVPLDYYAIIRHCSRRNIIGIIVEHCFMDNLEDVSYISTDEALDNLAVADAKGIAEYLGL